MLCVRRVQVCAVTAPVHPTRALGKINVQRCARWLIVVEMQINTKLRAASIRQSNGAHDAPPTLIIHKDSSGHPASGQREDFNRGSVLFATCRAICPPNPTVVIVNSDPDHVNKSMGIDVLCVM